MSEFSELLGKLIKQSETTVYGISKEINCGRTWLQKVISGERYMDYSTYLALHRQLSTFIEPAVLENLYDLYAGDYFGQKQFELILYIRDRLKETRRMEELLHKIKQQKTYLLADYIQERNLDDRQAGMLKKLDDMLVRTLEQSETVPVYVNIPANWKYMKDYLLMLMHLRKIRQPEQFQIISNSRFDGNREKERLENFLTSAEYASYGYNTYEGDASLGYESTDNLVFPYYIATGSEVYLFSVDGTVDLYVHDENVVFNIRKIFEQIVVKRKKFMQPVSLETYSTLLSFEKTGEDNHYFEGGH